MNHKTGTALITVSMLLLLQGILPADDWPTFRGDYRRSGISREELSFPLTKTWEVSSPLPPKKAWSGPAKWDSYANIKNRKSMRDFDPAFHVSAAGEQVFFGSNVDDAVHCLNADTGEEAWIYFTGGAVRATPTIHKGRVFFGSDDGFVYCIGHRNGQLIWKCRPGPQEKLVPFNGQLMSRYPCRTGVVVRENSAFFAASLLPWRPSYLCAVNAETGTAAGDHTFHRSYHGMTMQGAILASESKLYIPQGMQRPEVFSLKTGAHAGGIGKSGNGGCFAVLGPDYSLVHGRGQDHGSDGELRVFDRSTSEAIVTFKGAVSMVIDQETAWFATAGSVTAFNRARYLSLQKEKNRQTAQRESIKKAIERAAKKGDREQAASLQKKSSEVNKKLLDIAEASQKCFRWTRKPGPVHEIIMAGTTIFAGGTNTVSALNGKTGKLIWSAEVTGRAYGLAVANGRLFVSTHTGKIYCFKHPLKQ